jgi:hypothetical protein
VVVVTLVVVTLVVAEIFPGVVVLVVSIAYQVVVVTHFAVATVATLAV